MTESPIDDFIQTMGTMWQSEGGPRIAGQLLAYLLVEGEPRGLQQMCDALQISKGSASTNARLLEGKGLVRRVHPVGARQDAWLATPDPSLSILRDVSDRYRRNADTIAGICRGFPQDRQAARDRVERMAEFFRQSADFMDDWARHVGRDRDASREGS